MKLSLSKAFRTGAVLVTAAAFLFACTAETVAGKKKKRTPADPGDEFFEEDTSQEDGLTPTTNEDSGAFGAGARPSSGPRDAGGTRLDGGTEGGVVPKTYCEGPLKAGDLAVVELLVSSRAGSGDDGEWAEIASTRDCTLKLRGLTIESPRGAAAPNAVTIEEDFELPPRGTFLVAGSADPVKNGGLPGKVFAWNAADVLKNDGDTLALKVGAVTVDTITYPSFTNLEAGRTLAFPDDCTWAVRADWQRWSLTFHEYKAGKKGTPNATNDDVACY